VGNIGNLTYRSLLLAHRSYGVIPEGSPEQANVEQVQATIATIEEGLEEYEFKKVCDAALALSTHGNRYLQARQPWSHEKDDPHAKDAVHNALWLVKALAVLAEPLIPFKAEKTLQAFNLSPSPNIEEALAPLEPGLKLSRPEPLFQPMPDAKVEELTRELAERIRTAEG